MSEVGGAAGKAAPGHERRSRCPFCCHSVCHCWCANHVTCVT